MRKGAKSKPDLAVLVKKLRTSNKFKTEQSKWEALIQPHLDAIDRCTRITAEDLAITINVKD